jgi:outer membrane protein OmpA-like peptidoglycan-associated protein
VRLNERFRQELKEPGMSMELPLNCITAFCCFDPGLYEENEKILIALRDFLKSDPEAIIQIEHYSDCRGDVNYNLELTRRRSESLKKWLVGRGIKKNRITPIGYGSSKPVVVCPDNDCDKCTEEEHEKNRERVTVTRIR